MKLYFPTTSLNFNDIFATESISPKYFYQNRTYGTQRHFTTELSLNEYCIALFKEIPYFKLIDSSISEYEQFPIVFEFNIDPELYELVKVNDDVYVTYKTLYLDFDNVKVLFFSKIDYKTIIAKSELVSETKTIHKYKSKFIFMNYENLTASLNNSTLPLLPKLINDEEISYELKRDRIFNHIKGFYYGYMIHKTVLNYKKRSHELSIHLESLDKLKEFLNLYKNLNSKNTEVILDITNTSLKYAEIDMELSRSLFENIIKGFAIFQLNDKVNIEFNKNKIEITDEMIVYQIILNCILNSPKTKDIDSKIEIEKIIKNIGFEIIKKFGKNSNYNKDFKLIFEKVIHRVYNLDILTIDSNVLQNFLAFVMKYKNVDELFTFLELKKVKSSNIAYSFLGAFIGFSGLSKTITNNLFSDDNEELLRYIDTIITEFRQQIWTKTRISQNLFSNKEIDLCDCINKVNPDQNVSNIQIKESMELNQNQILQYNTNELEIRKPLYIEIQRIKSNKILNSFLKKSKITLPSGDIQVTFENVGDDIDITFLDTKHDKIINLKLKSKINLLSQEETLFKKTLLELGLKFSFSGNFPMFKYSKTVGDKNQELNIEEEKRLLEYLRLLI